MNFKFENKNNCAFLLFLATVNTNKKTAIHYKPMHYRDTGTVLPAETTAKN